MEKYYRVKTVNKTFKVKAVETSKGFFGGKIIWKLYSANYNSLFHSYTHIGDCDDVNRIGEAIRLAIPNVKNIEVIK